MPNEQAVELEHEVDAEHEVEVEHEHEHEVDAEQAFAVAVVCYSVRNCRCGADMELVDRDGARGGHWLCRTCGRQRHRH